MIDLPDEQLATVRSILRDHVDEAQVFAFGSRVMGKAKQFSDLDLMIKAPEALSWRQLADLRESFEASDLPITVDVVDWQGCSEEFKQLVAGQLVALN